MKVATRCEASLSNRFFTIFRPSKNVVSYDNSVLAPTISRFYCRNHLGIIILTKRFRTFTRPGFPATQKVISYCKSHMQMTKHSPRLHETYGFEVRIRQSTLQERCTVEQLTFRTAKLLIISFSGVGEFEVRFSEL